MTTRRWIAVIVGAVVALVGFGVAFGGAAISVTYEVRRDHDGYVSSPTESLRSGSRAVVSSSVDLRLEPGRGELLPDELGRIRVRVERADGGDVFLGIASSADVERYLAGVAYDELTDVGFDPFTTEYLHVAGDGVPLPPAEQDFWVVQAVGAGARQITWDLTDGTWMAVVMNADGSPGVDVEVSAGATASWVLPLGLGLLAGGLLGLAAGVGLLMAGASGAVDHLHPHNRSAAEYPVHLIGRLDEPLSRWRWLVKWALVLPHVLVLIPLWIGFVALTFVAFVQILATGRYPRSLFGFNVGVLRWTWRVGYYAFGALGTDRYPPFSLEPDPRYPADLVIEYPERLSRGLVLVKWLLALPHYLVLALLTGGVGFHFGGAVGLLLLAAVLVLLVTGRYPRALFDVVMGCNRWSFRVLAYLCLLRDEYPPFRFDAGDDDRAAPPPPPPSPTQPPSSTSEPLVVGV